MSKAADKPAAFFCLGVIMPRTATKPKTQEKELELPQIGEAAVHHMTRSLAAIPGNNQFTGDQLDAHCQTWLDQGYRLHTVHPTYVTPEQGPGGVAVTEAQWHILYIFVKD
jgi:hypothetical protein